MRNCWGCCCGAMQSWLAVLLVLQLGAAAAAAPAPPLATNPLLTAGAFPLWDQIKPANIKPAVQQVLAEEGAAFTLLEQDLVRAGRNVTFDRIFKPYTQMELRIDAVTGQIDHLSGVEDTPALRAAKESVDDIRTAFALRLGQSRPLYNALSALKANKAEWARLAPEQRRLVSNTLDGLRDSGVGLAPPQRAEFNDIINKLRQLSTAFDNNVLDATKAFQVLITDKAGVAGLEPTTLAVAADAAKAAGHKNATAAAGPWLLQLSYNTYASVLAYAKDRALRKRFYLAMRSVATSGKTDNAPIVRQMLQLRQRMARLLGYKTYADYAFRSRMATLDKANKLMEQLTAASRPKAIEEDRVLTAFARKATNDPKLKLEIWDIPYWAERQKEALFSYNQEELRQYLPTDSVIQGLLKLAGRLYGIDITPVKQKLPVWNKDVRVYQISNQGDSKPLAYVYADVYARPGTKQSGAWVQPLWDAARYWRAPGPVAAAAATAAKQKLSVPDALRKAPGLAAKQAAWIASAPKQLPIAMLVANQDPPAGGKPSLMTMDDAQTLFHEFGHALQHMLSTTRQGLQSGMRNIEWDAVEFPSQMQEKWIYNKPTFDSFARHYKSGKVAPASLYDKVKGLETYRKGNYFAYQLMLALTDLGLHSTFDPYGNKSAAQLQQEIYKRVMPYAPYPGDRQIYSFSHIFAGGYSAGYYSYMWADVMSTDALSAFTEVGTNNNAAVRQLGKRFRNSILATGGSQPPGQAFKAFRGRAPRVEPLLAYYGLL